MYEKRNTFIQIEIEREGFVNKLSHDKDNIESNEIRIKTNEQNEREWRKRRNKKHDENAFIFLKLVSMSVLGGKPQCCMYGSKTDIKSPHLFPHAYTWNEPILNTNEIWEIIETKKKEI